MGVQRLRQALGESDALFARVGVLGDRGPLLKRDGISRLFFFEILRRRSNDATEDGELKHFEKGLENELEKELDGFHYL
jgi:hypothetical protein